MKILYCDDRDDAELPPSAEETTGAEHTWTKLIGDNLKTAVQQLFARVKWQLGESQESPSDEDLDKFDNADVVLLDYGLTTLDLGGVRLTADMIAGYLRAFTKCGYVVSLNKSPLVDFDLKYLLGDFDTRADLALNAKHLDIKGLWFGETNGEEFCPWYWPALLDAPRRRREQIEQIKANVNESILKTLGFPKAVLPLLSRQAIGFLSPEAREDDASERRGLPDVTFWTHFRTSNRTLPKNDRDALVERLAPNTPKRANPADVVDYPNDCPPNGELIEIVARVVAGELDFWFRRDILGPQRLLIDAPHLQHWLRGRSAEEENTPESWNASTRRPKDKNFGLPRGFRATCPRNALFIGTPWTDGPCFWFPLIEANEKVATFGKNLRKDRDYVFCEDVRAFLPRTEARRFTTELGRGLDIRFVKKVLLQNYSPLSQFAL
jgi:hypothetical protein